MKEIVVNDTNILIDMHAAGLLEYVRLSGTRFHTTDLVIEELHNSPYKRPSIDLLVEEGFLQVVTTSQEEMAEVFSLYSDCAINTNLSFVDCSVMHYAKKHNYRLLTGDKKLKHHAIDKGIIVSGLLWVVDLFVEEGLVEAHEMILKLNVLLGMNSRLPEKLILDKIEQLEEMKSF